MIKSTLSAAVAALAISSTGAAAAETFQCISPRSEIGVMIKQQHNTPFDGLAANEHLVKLAELKCSHMVTLQYLLPRMLDIDQTTAMNLDDFFLELSIGANR